MALRETRYCPSCEGLRVHINDRCLDCPREQGEVATEALDLLIKHINELVGESNAQKKRIGQLERAVEQLSSVLDPTITQGT